MLAPKSTWGLALGSPPELKVKSPPKFIVSLTENTPLMTPRTEPAGVVTGPSKIKLYPVKSSTKPVPLRLTAPPLKWVEPASLSTVKVPLASTLPFWTNFTAFNSANAEKLTSLALTKVSWPNSVPAPMAWLKVIDPAPTFKLRLFPWKANPSTDPLNVRLPSAPLVLPVPCPPKAIISMLGAPIRMSPKLMVAAAPPCPPPLTALPPEALIDPFKILVPAAAKLMDPAAPPSPPPAPAAPPLTSSAPKVTFPAVAFRLNEPPSPPLPVPAPSPPLKATLCAVTLVPVMEMFPPLDPGPLAVPPASGMGTPPRDKTVPFTVTAPELFKVKFPPLAAFETAERSAPAPKVIPLPAPVVVMLRLLPVVANTGVMLMGPAMSKELPLSTLTADPLATVSPVKVDTFPPKPRIPADPPRNVRV